MTSINNRLLASPSFMIEPLPYLRSIWLMAAWRAFSFSVPGPAAIAAAAATAAAEGVEDALAITRVLLCQPVVPALLSAVDCSGGGCPST
jgi:hypothetical protein